MIWNKISQMFSSQKGQKKLGKNLMYCYDETIPKFSNRWREVIKNGLFKPKHTSCAALVAAEIRFINENYPEVFIQIKRIIMNRRLQPISEDDIKNQQELLELYESVREQFGWRFESAIKWYATVYEAKLYTRQPYPRLNFDDIYWFLSIQRDILEAYGISPYYFENGYIAILSNECYITKNIRLFDAIEEIIDEKYGSYVKDYLIQFDTPKEDQKRIFISEIIKCFLDNRLALEKELYEDLSK